MHLMINDNFHYGFSLLKRRYIMHINAKMLFKICVRYAVEFKYLIFCINYGMVKKLFNNIGGYKSLIFFMLFHTVKFQHIKHHNIVCRLKKEKPVDIWSLVD